MNANCKEIHTIVAGRETVIFCPAEGTANGRWALKTEYLPAFPDVQERLVDMGYHLAYITNITRWCLDSDTDARAELAEYMHKTYGVSKKCVPIGMSCGGLQAIYFAAKYPQYVSCLYLDAPVVNLLSCPAALGNSKEDFSQELYDATGLNRSKLLTYRNHPQDHIPELIEANIPVMLVCGDSDSIVPFEENGQILDKMYRAAGCPIETIVKPGCDHHPHSLEDNTPILEFIKKYDKD